MFFCKLQLYIYIYLTQISKFIDVKGEIQVVSFLSHGYNWYKKRFDHCNKMSLIALQTE